MWFLHQRNHTHSQSLPGSESQSIGRTDPTGDVRCAVPVWCAYANHARHQAVRCGGEGMNRTHSLKSLTQDARGALEKTGMSRRDFIRGSGALVVAFSIAGLKIPGEMASGQALAPDFSGPGSNQLDSWIAIGADGRVTAYTGKCELGQGLYTAQTQLIAEELCVPFDRVKLIQCDTALTPDQGTTSGAQSHPTNFNNKKLALACATAHE